MSKRALPTFIEPMLALPAEPFDSEDHLFEIKWDGFRAVALIDSGRYRLLGRRKTDFTPAFPELAALTSLPEGTAIDGEIVTLINGKPDFAALLRRNRAGIRPPGRSTRAPPATFVAFDLLYRSFKSIQPLPCEERRARLAGMLEQSHHPRILLSQAIIGDGRAMFAEARKLSLEGVIAKRRNSRYEPGQRSGAWMKFKARRQLLCAIIGYQVRPDRMLKSLIIAAPIEGKLRWVGKVGSGINVATQHRLLGLLKIRRCPRPVIECSIEGNWVVPDLFCRVSFLEWTGGGKLRGPVFESLYDG